METSRDLPLSQQTTTPELPSTVPSSPAERSFGLRSGNDGAQVSERSDSAALRAQGESIRLLWREGLSAWLNLLERPSTKRNYSATIEMLFERDGIGSCLEDVTAEHLGAWREELAQRVELPEHHPAYLTPASVNRYLAAARSFFQFWRLCNTPAHVYVRFSLEVQNTVLQPVRRLAKRPSQVLHRTRVRLC